MDRMIRARAVLAELDALGLTVEDLVAAGGTATVAGVPTVAEYVEVVAASYRPGTAATYRRAKARRATSRRSRRENAR